MPKYCIGRGGGGGGCTVASLSGWRLIPRLCFRAGGAGEVACLAGSVVEGWGSFSFVGDKWLCPSCMGPVPRCFLPGLPQARSPRPQKGPALRFFGGRDLDSDLCF